MKKPGYNIKDLKVGMGHVSRAAKKRRVKRKAKRTAKRRY